MRSQRALASMFVRGLAAALWVAAPFVAVTALAQQGMPGPPPGERDPFAVVRERQRREAQLRGAEMFGKGAPVDKRSAEVAAAQLREDFRRIQVLRNEIARHLLSGKPLDFKFIAKETEEVNTRAGRLKAFLAPEAAESKEQKRAGEIGEGLMKDALVTLCKRIDSFTDNPMFKMPEVIDVKEFEKAGKDLETIVLLSEGVRKGAERAGKTAKK